MGNKVRVGRPIRVGRDFRRVLLKDRGAIVVRTELPGSAVLLGVIKSIGGGAEL